MRRAFAAAFVLITASAAAPARADDASRLQAARTIVEVTHAADNLRRFLPTFSQQMRPLLLQSGADAKEVDTFMTEIGKRFAAQTDSFVDLAAQVYAREFSQDDLDALLAFYRMPAGQHLLDKQVVITQGMVAVGQQWGQAVARQVLDDFAKRKAQDPKL